MDKVLSNRLFSGLFNLLMILILSVLFGTLSETFIVYVVLIFTACRRWLACKN